MQLDKALRYGGWLFVLAAVVCAGVAVWDWREAHRIGVMRSGGVEAIARIVSGQRVSWKGAAAYAVNLSWSDGSGQKREARAVPVTARYAREIVRGGQLLTLAVAIKYMPDDQVAAPVVVADATRREEELWARVHRMIWLAIAAFGVFAVCQVAMRRWVR